MLIRNHLLILLLIAGGGLFAQPDTAAEYTQDFADEDSVIFVHPMDYAFMMHEETKWSASFLQSATEEDLFSQNKVISQLPMVELQHKVTPWLSLNLGLTTRENPDWTAGIRWYPFKLKRTARLRSRNNLSGNYLQVLYRTHKNKQHEPASYDVWGIRVGWQRRFLGHGLIDVSIEGGWRSSNAYQAKHFGFGTNVRLGLGVFHASKPFPADQICGVFKCYEQINSLLKINLARLVNARLLGPSTFLSTGTNISYEKWLSGPLSLNVALVVGLTRQNFTSWTDHGNHVAVALEGRYYLGQKRRLMLGRSHGKLSGPYLALETRYTRARQTHHSIRVRDTGAASAILLGIQSVLSNNFYFDLRLGARLYWWHRFTYGGKRLSVEEWKMPLELRIGYSF